MDSYLSPCQSNVGQRWIPACHHAGRVCGKDAPCDYASLMQARDASLPVTTNSYRFSLQYNRIKI